MNHNICDIIAKYLDNKETIRIAEDSIKHETKIYKEKIAPHSVEISTCQEEIKQIKESEVKANLGDIVKTLAQIWETSPENLSVSCHSTFVYSGKQRASFRGVKDISGYDLMTFLISYKSEKAPLRHASISAPFNKDDIQADGKSLYDHIDYMQSLRHRGIYSGLSVGKNVELKFEDINAIVLSIKFNQLLDLTGKLKSDDKTQAIVNACELYAKKHQNQTM